MSSYFHFKAFFILLFTGLSFSSIAQNVGIGTTVPKSKMDISGNLTVGSYSGTNAAPTNGAIISGNTGIGTAGPLYRLHIVHSSSTDGLTLQNTGGGSGSTTNLYFATYADVTAGTTHPGARISGIDDGNYSAHLTFSTKIPGADGNAFTERMRLESSGDLKMENGSSIHMPSNVAYIVDRNQRTNSASLRGNISATTGNLSVETGDVVVITTSLKFAWTGGSGTDQPIFGVSVTGCASATLTDSYQVGDADDITRGQTQPMSFQYVYVATCTGNLQFAVYIDAATNANDTFYTQDAVLVARKY